jgi:hypothetical protein
MSHTSAAVLWGLPLYAMRLARVHMTTASPRRISDGRPYFVDFGLADVCSFGEFDGRTKYLDEALRSGRTVEQVLLAEKQREDWIRGRTQWRFARCGSEHIVTPAALAARLAAFHITPP